MQYTSREVYEFISKHNNDPIVERKTCTVSGQPFAIFQSDLDFYTKISPTFAGQKFQIPTPTLCPEERQRRRLMFRNERKLYKRKCDATGDNMISMYSPDKIYKVYDQKYRRSDKWDAITYGKTFDFSRSFGEQFNNLMIETPKINLSNDNMSENSIYVNQTTYQKNCYMTFDADNDENVLYSRSIKFSKSCIDALSTYYSEVCYETVNCTNCMGCFFCRECETSNNLFLCERCISCNDCFGCINLVNKSYCIHNKQHTKEEYFKKLEEEKEKYFATSSSYDTAILAWNSNFIKRTTYKIQDEGSCGNNLAYTKDCHFCNNIGHGKLLKYCSFINNSEYCYDFDIWGLDCSLIYECVTVGENASFSAFNIECWGNMSHVYYSHYCLGCTNCFGCVSLRNKQYCIFNKQYTKEEYEIQVAKIIAHMQSTGERGEFFHPSLSPFGYNETIAQEYFPMMRQEAAARKYSRQTNNYDPIIPEGAKVIDWKIAEQEPQDEEQILKAIFVCEVSARPYRIIKQELEFYRKHHLPLPRKHPDMRHEERMKLRPGRILYLRQCDKCRKEMLSVYPPLTPPYYGGESSPRRGSGEADGVSSKVYCESCYQQEVYA